MKTNNYASNENLTQFKTELHDSTYLQQWNTSFLCWTPILYTVKWSATKSLGNSLHSSTPWNMTNNLSKPPQSDLQIDESQNRSWIQHILHVDIDVISRKHSVCMLE